MKRVLLSILIVLMLALSCEAQQVFVMKKKAGGSSLAYFGYQADKSSPSISTWDQNASQGSYTKASLWQYGGTTGTLSDLCVWVKSAGGTAANIRIALYDNAGNLIAQWGSEVNISSTTAAWVCAPSLSATPTITNGNYYRLASGVDGSDVQIGYTTGSSGDFTYESADRTGGFPATITASSNSTRLRALIAEVTY